MRIASILSLAALYAFAITAWGMPPMAGALYLAASLACFALYAIDKSAARAGRWRISENTLLLVGLACGWPGGVLAQQWLRHKSSKPAFRTRFWVTVGANLLAFAWLASPLSMLRW